MDTKNNPDGKRITGTGRKILVAVIVLIVFLALVLAARYLVGSVDIVELLKKIHGG